MHLDTNTKVGKVKNVLTSWQDLTFPTLSEAPACGDDTAYNMQPGPPQTHAGTASDSPEITGRKI